MPEERDEGAADRKGLVHLGRLSQFALVLPAATLIGYFAGKALGEWLHQDWMAIAGLIIGSIAGLADLIRTAIDASSGKE